VIFAGSAAINSFDRLELSLLNRAQGERYYFFQPARSTAMSYNLFSSYPSSTQDWSLAKNRALALQAAQVKSVQSLSGALWVTASGSSQDFFLQSGEHVLIPCTHGLVVIEPLGADAVVRVGQHVEARYGHTQQQSFARAMYVSVICPVARGLRKMADWLQPTIMVSGANPSTGTAFGSRQSVRGTY
jgi:hypothetical protein